MDRIRPGPRKHEEALNWMGELTLLKVSGEDSGGLYSMAEVFVTPEGFVPLHVHHREDEAFYVLDGELTIQIGGAIHEAQPGSFVLGPKDVPHKYVVKSPTARLLMIFSPAGFEGFIRATNVAPVSPAPRLWASSRSISTRSWRLLPGSAPTSWSKTRNKCCLT